ncbi:AAC(3) family N-acetyltransferase [Cupriavidus sp. AU9028]|uniref:AAC(3) family N-acetyltransferase n=1 Tax=Cupriavidus sp. AU9028 TaxID=2871157 RepID=UPI001C955B55|nr:AAC(3) family N-acetyltransferase [Cupriavidus sp. AU9028]MBY4897756.1 AAC(3) family N-acetyltransferase [Cupriavidus sp. AU9028]
MSEPAAFPTTVATPEGIVGQLRALGVMPGDVLLVHASLRSVGPVAGGAAALIGALQEAVGRSGTVAMPSWTGDDDRVFDPATTPSAPDLGALARLFWQSEGVQRSDHPFAFAAAGRHAREIVRGPLPLPPHGPDSPVGRIHALDGQVLLLGVGHDANTTLHLAEVMAGVPYGVPGYCTVAGAGHVVRVRYRENDHCCQRFALADEWLRESGRQREGPVGQAHARLMRARHLVEAAMTALADDPLVFLHPPSADCEECDAARRSIG